MTYRKGGKGWEGDVGKGLKVMRRKVQLSPEGPVRILWPPGRDAKTLGSEAEGIHRLSTASSWQVP